MQNWRLLEMLPVKSLTKLEETIRSSRTCVLPTTASMREVNKFPTELKGQANFIKLEISTFHWGWRSVFYALMKIRAKNTHMRFTTKF